MKTVQKGEDIKRLKDDEAELHVKSRGYKYVPKSVWKETKRPSKQNDTEVVEDKKPKGKKSNEKPQ
jgi:hypothetical protein